MYDLSALVLAYHSGDLAQVTRPGQVEGEMGSELFERLVQMAEGIRLHRLEIENLCISVSWTCGVSAWLEKVRL